MNALPLTSSALAPEAADHEQSRTRTQQLFAHIATHGLTLKVIASRLFCDGSKTKTNNLFDPLLKEGRLIAFSLRNGRKYYTLGPDDADRFRLPRTRGRLSGLRVQTTLAVLSFCYLTNSRRLRVPARALKEVLGFVPRQRDAVFVIEDAPETYVARIIVPGPGTKPDYALKIVSGEQRWILQNPIASALVEPGTFRFVVLVDSAARRDQFRESFTTAKSRQRISSRLRVDVLEVIDPTTVPMFPNGGQQ